MDLKKKFTQEQPNDPTPIGNLVHWYILQQNIKKKEVARQLNVSGITLNAYFKQKSIQTVILWRICKAINYNLFAYLAEKINIPFETTTEKELKIKLQEAHQEIHDLKQENQLLKELFKR